MGAWWSKPVDDYEETEDEFLWLQSLPVEVLIIIVKKLDTQSMFNLYEAGVSLPWLDTECQLSANTLATANALTTNFFHDVSPNIKVLNLCGALDLEITKLTDAIENMNKLTHLNIMYTDIKMTDFPQIVKARPTLTSIAIDFYFPDPYISEISDEVLLEYQKAFEGLKDVHFIGPLDKTVHGAMALHMLEKADLNSLKFTSNVGTEAWRIDADRWENIKMVKASRFQLYLLPTIRNFRRVDPPVFRVMDFAKYEILIIKANMHSDSIHRYSVFATLLLKNLIEETFSVEVECLSDWLEFRNYYEMLNRIEPRSQRETVFMFWDKERNRFGEEFRKNVLKIFKKHYVHTLDSNNSKPVPPEFEYYCVEPISQNSGVVLDYGNAYKDKDFVKLDIMYNDDLQGNIPKMINNCDFLNKLRHLGLRGREIKYDLDFFSNLFENCRVLVTLKIENSRGDRCVTSEHLQSIHKCKSLKNFYLVSSGIHLPSLYKYLSECRGLENIYLYNFTNLERVHNLPDPTELFSNLNNLYNFIVMTELDGRTIEKVKSVYNKVRTDLGKAALNIDIGFYRNGYTHPYVGVFNTYQL